MTLEIIRAALGWCAIINMGLLLVWAFFVIVAHDFVYRIHTRWFKLSRETFDAIHYSGMAAYKLSIFMFNLVPYFALRIVG
jgi:hypothetical protein